MLYINIRLDWLMKEHVKAAAAPATSEKLLVLARTRAAASRLPSLLPLLSSPSSPPAYGRRARVMSAAVQCPNCGSLRKPGLPRKQCATHHITLFLWLEAPRPHAAVPFKDSLQRAPMELRDSGGASSARISSSPSTARAFSVPPTLAHTSDTCRGDHEASVMTTRDSDKQQPHIQPCHKPTCHCLFVRLHRDMHLWSQKD